MRAGGNTKFDRFYVALGVTYDQDGNVDYDEFREYCKYFTKQEFLDHRFSYIVNPEAGEIFALNLEERRKLVEIGREVMPADVPVFAGVTGASLKEAIATAKDAKAAGADGLFVCPPLGSADITISWDQEVYPEIWLDWVLAIDKAVDMPIIIHPSTPGNTKWGGGLSIDLVKQTVLQCKNVVGWKAIAEEMYFPAYCKMLRELEKETGRHISILGAGAFQFITFAMMDCLDGCVSCFANFSMEALCKVFDRINADDLDGAQALLKNGMNQLFIFATAGEAGRMCLHTNFKVATWLRGLIKNPLCREPMRKPHKAEVRKLAELLRNIGYELIPQEQIDAFIDTLPRESI